MAADPVEGMARALCVSQGLDPDVPGIEGEQWQWWQDEARAAWDYALVTLRDGFRGDPRLIGDIVGDFARRHGLEPPP